MPSYTSSLRLLQPSTGEYPGTWGTQVNTGLTALVDTSVAGTATITMTAADYTLSTANGATDEARAMVLNLTGTPGAARNVICPAVSKVYIVYNNTTGGFAQTLKTASGSGISVPNGATAFLRCNGTDVVTAANYFGSLTLPGTPNGVVYLNGSNVVTSGSALTFDGTGVQRITATAGAFQLYKDATPTRAARFAINTVATDAAEMSVYNGTAWNDSFYVSPSSFAAWQLNGSEQMRLTTTGLLIGTTTNTNSRRLLVNGTGSGSTYAAVGDLSQTASQTLLGIDPAGTTGYVGNTTWALGFLTNGTEKARIDTAGNLGLGVTPSAQGVYRTMQFGNYLTIGQQTTGTAQSFFGWNVRGSSTANQYLYNVTADKAALYEIVSDASHRWSVTNTSGTAGNAISFTEAMRLDASGNLGLGVTPSAANTPTIQSNLGVLTGNTETNVASNAYFNSGWKYTGTGFASLYLQATAAGSHRWYTAPSGTAGNAISFTQAMTLDASGNLGVGVVPGGSYKFQVSTTGGSAAQFISPQGNPQITASDNNVTVYVGYTSGTGASAVSYFGTSTNHAQAFLTNNVEKGRFTTAGDFLVGTTSSAAYTNGFFANATYINSGHASGTAGGTGYVLFGYDNAAIGSISQNGTTGVLFNTTSDRRLKDNIVPAPSASDDIDAIQIVSHDWKAATDEHVKYGVIAQDLHAVAPQAVTVGDDGDEIEKTWGVDYSKLVPMLIKEIQSLRARVAALEAA
jgi:hypothetical protein